jgi:hypothetical protein
MTPENEHQGDENTGVPPLSTLEQFLQAIEKKTGNPVHHQLLKVCRQANPSDALEAELRKIVSEIINEA